MEITRTMEVYTLDELDDKARARAVDGLCDGERDRVESSWITEQVAGDLAYTLDPDYDGGDMGEDEFESRYGLRLFWSVGYSQSDFGAVEGTISRRDFPKLAWPDGVASIQATYERWGGAGVADVHAPECEGSCDIPDGAWSAAEELVRGLGRMVYDAARDAYEGMTSEENVLMLYDDGIRGPKRRFLADGSEAPGEFWTDDASPQVRAV